MARVEVHSDRVVIRLTSSEQMLALRRKDLVLDRSAIVSAIITDNPRIWIRGVRAPGARLPGKLAIGTWRGSAGRDFMILRSDRDAVVIDFDASRAQTGEDAGDSIEPGVTNGASADPGEAHESSEFDRFSRVIISTKHAAELVRALRLDSAGGVVNG